MDKFNLDNYQIIEENEGHYVFNKKELRNPYLVLENTKNSLDKKVLVNILKKNGDKNSYFLIDYINLNKVMINSGKFRTWFSTSAGYIMSHDGGKPIYLHHLLMDFESKGKGFQDSSVDHIDRNPMNNTMANLRIATIEEQQSNTKGGVDCPGTKRARKKNAQELPSALNGIELPKYVTYNSENYKTASGVSRREYFRIEKHPLQVKGVVKDKKKTTSKQSVNILDKLEEAKQIIKTFDEQLNNL